MEVKGTLYDQGTEIHTQGFQVETTTEIAEMAMDAFQNVRRIDEIVFHKSDGTYIASFYNRPDQGFVTKWAGIGWDRPLNNVEVGDVAEAMGLQALRARRTRENLWDAFGPEVEAWGRLRAALRGLGGDL